MTSAECRVVDSLTLTVCYSKSSDNAVNTTVTSFLSTVNTTVYFLSSNKQHVLLDKPCLLYSWAHECGGDDTLNY